MSFARPGFTRSGACTACPFVLALSLLMLLLLFQRSLPFPFAPDSASYLEQARNLIRVGSAVEVGYGFDHLGLERSRLFPIGYPVILAGFGYVFGADPRTASLFLTALSAALLPLLVFAAFRRALGDYRALAIVFLTALSPSALSYSALGTPDMLALALAVSSIALLLNKPSRAGLFLAGLLAGTAYAVRNAHLALVTAVAVYMVYLWWRDPQARRQTFAASLYLFAGILVIALPLIVRNLVIFGSPNPYSMAASTIPLVTNIRTYFQETIYDLTAVRGIATFVGWSQAGAFVSLIFLIAVGWYLKTQWAGLPDFRKRVAVMTLSYTAIGAATVIAARTRFEWGETINIRHTLQYTPFVLAGLAAAFPDTRARSTPAIALVVAFLFVAGAHVSYAWQPRELSLRDQRSRSAAEAYDAGKSFMCREYDNTIAASNWGYVFTVACGTATRNIELAQFACATNARGCDPVVRSAEYVAKRFPQKAIRLAFFPGRGIAESGYGLSEVGAQDLRDMGYTVELKRQGGLLLVKPAVRLDQSSKAAPRAS